MHPLPLPGEFNAEITQFLGNKLLSGNDIRRFFHIRLFSFAGPAFVEFGVLAVGLTRGFVPG